MSIGIYIFLAVGILLVAGLGFFFFCTSKAKAVSKIQIFAAVDNVNAEYITKELIYNSDTLCKRGIEADIYIIYQKDDVQTAQMISLLKKKQTNLHMIQAG